MRGAKRGVQIAACAGLVGACFHPTGSASNSTSAGETEGATETGAGSTSSGGSTTTATGSGGPTTSTSETTTTTTTGATDPTATSTSMTGTPGVCGDGVMDPGEECDDGDADDTDACTAGCKLAKCGDGFVQAGTEACDDGNPVNTDACTAGCELAKCGDGFVQAGEACDDGNLVDDDGCTNGCTDVKCGNGMTEDGEECDDGNMDDFDQCSSGCKTQMCGNGVVEGAEECDEMNMTELGGCTSCRRDLFVFLSSATYDGDLGGVAGADAKCTALAQGKLPGAKYVALVGANGSLPLARLGASSRPFVLPNLVKVAVDKAALLEMNLTNAIAVTESGAEPAEAASCMPGSGLAWTGLVDGKTLGANCSAWTTGGVGLGGAGYWQTVNIQRFAACPGQQCSSMQRLYCAEYHD